MAAQFDSALAARLIAFQRDHGLLADGLAGPVTWTKLAEVSGGRPTKTTTPAASVPGPDLTPENFPTLFQLAEACRTEDGIWALLASEAGFDRAEVLATIDAVLES